MDKVAVITGASSGIGRATAHEFAKQGYNLVLAARRQEELEDAADECSEYGVTARTYALDTANDVEVHELAAYAVEQFGRIDVWINGAAVYIAGKFEDVPLQDMRRLMDVNFFGYIHGSHAALRQFREQGFGTLINISSVNAAAPMPYFGIYSASKAAIRAFDESLRMELKLEGLDKAIHVSTVLPATFDTNLFQNAANYTGSPLQAIEPVYEPTYAAKNIFLLAEFPRREIFIGIAGRLLAFQNTFMPRLFESTVGRFVNRNGFTDGDRTETRGNLYESIPMHKGVHGGWRQYRQRADQLNIVIGAGIGLVAAASLVAYVTLRKKTQS